jgi:hypothetical protein
LEEGSNLDGATAVLLEIVGPEVKRESALQRELELSAITDAAHGVIVYTIHQDDFPVPGVHRLFVSVGFGPDQRLVASGKINIEG